MRKLHATLLAFILSSVTSANLEHFSLDSRTQSGRDIPREQESCMNELGKRTLRYEPLGTMNQSIWIWDFTIEKLQGPRIKRVNPLIGKSYYQLISESPEKVLLETVHPSFIDTGPNRIFVENKGGYPPVVDIYIFAPSGRSVSKVQTLTLSENAGGIVTTVHNSYLPDGSRILAIGFSNGYVSVYKTLEDSSGHAAFSLTGLYKTHESSIKSIAIQKRGHCIVTDGTSLKMIENSDEETSIRLPSKYDHVRLEDVKILVHPDGDALLVYNRKTFLIYSLFDSSWVLLRWPQEFQNIRFVEFGFRGTFSIYTDDIKGGLWRQSYMLYYEFNF